MSDRPDWRCETCKHFRESGDECERITNADGDDKACLFVAAFKQEQVLDASLLVEPDFGCVLWEKKDE